MIFYTAKLSLKKLTAVLFVMGLIIAAVILFFPEKEAMGQEAFASGEKITCESDMGQYIRSLGYDAGDAPESSREVRIPQSFDLVYEKYNEMQKECGFDLSKYKGQSAELYTYSIEDYPNKGEGALCDLLVCRKRLIGGNIYTVNTDGFMHGLKAR